MKKLSIGVVASALIASSLYAQSGEEAATSATTSFKGIEFSGSITTGMHSEIAGAVSDGATTTLIGPYIYPTLSLDYEGSNFNISTGYEFEAFGGQGIGGGFGDASKDFEDNAYFQHKPTLFLSGKVSPRVTWTNYAEYILTTYSGDQTANTTEAYIEPNLKYKLNDRLTVGVGYHYYRVENPDAVGITDDGFSTFASQDVKDPNKRFEQLSGELGAKLNLLNESLQNQVTQRHAGKALAEVKVSDATTYKTYVHAGRRFYRKGDDRSIYRWNNDLSTKLSQNLNGFFRYRFNIQDIDNSADLNWYHYVVVELTYALTKNTSAVFSNELLYHQTNTDAPEAYESSNYLGLSYSF